MASCAFVGSPDSSHDDDDDAVFLLDEDLQLIKNDKQSENNESTISELADFRVIPMVAIDRIKQLYTRRGPALNTQQRMSTTTSVDDIGIGHRVIVGFALRPEEKKLKK